MAISGTHTLQSSTGGGSISESIGGKTRLIPAGVTVTLTYVNGTGAGAVNEIFEATGAVGAGATHTWDFYAGNVLRPSSTPVNATGMKYIKVVNYNTAGTLTLKPAAAAAMAGPFPSTASTGIIVPAATSATAPGIFTIGGNGASVWPIAAGADSLAVINNDGANVATYDIEAGLTV